MNAGQALGYGRQTLVGKSDHPARDASLLLAHVLGCSTSDLYLHPEAPVSQAQFERYSSLIARRALKEPMAYILGYKEFMGLRFKVDRRVLIPRPETEILVETCLSVLGDMIRNGRARPITVCDVCCGSGAIGLSILRLVPELSSSAPSNLPQDPPRDLSGDQSAPDLAMPVAWGTSFKLSVRMASAEEPLRNSSREPLRNSSGKPLRDSSEEGDSFEEQPRDSSEARPRDSSKESSRDSFGKSPRDSSEEPLRDSLEEPPMVRVILTDISEDALDVARYNAQQLGVLDEAEFVLGDGLEPLECLGLQGKVDIIASNPPYIPTEVIPTLDDEVKHYEPHLALDGGRDGMDLIEHLILRAPSMLAPDGYLILEIGHDQADKCRHLLAETRSADRGVRAHSPQTQSQTFPSPWSDWWFVKDYAGIERVLVAKARGNT